VGQAPEAGSCLCPAARLAVEVDGAGHGEDAQRAHDERRDAWLGARGITVYRVWASSVFADVDEVADQVRRMADELVAGCGGRPLRQPLFGG